MPQFLPRIARYPRPRHSAVQSTSPVPLQTPLPNRCANPQFLSRRQAKPIKEPASRYGLVHRAVYSIPRRADVLLLLGFPPPRNRANLFQSQPFSHFFLSDFNKSSVQPPTAVVLCDRKSCSLAKRQPTVTMQARPAGGRNLINMDQRYRRTPGRRSKISATAFPSGKGIAIPPCSFHKQRRQPPGLGLQSG